MADKKSSQIEVVVLKRKTVVHDSETYSENSLLTLDSADAERLISAGFVATREGLLAAATVAVEGATVSTETTGTVEPSADTIKA